MFESEDKLLVAIMSVDYEDWERVPSSSSDYCHDYLIRKRVRLDPDSKTCIDEKTQKILLDPYPSMLTNRIQGFIDYLSERKKAEQEELIEEVISDLEDTNMKGDSNV